VSASLQRLFPDPGPTTVEEQYSQLDLGSLAPEGRPYVVTNFAVTVDGRATISGRSGAIGSSTDTEVLQQLRTQVDAVMIGAGTMRAERYGRIVSDPELRGRRERAEKLAPDPVAVIVSNSLDLPWDAGLFTSGYGRVVIFTTSELDPPKTATSLRIMRFKGEVDLAAGLGMLRSERGVRALLCEGGPRLHGNLVDAGLVDELFVTLAPKLAGGTGPNLVEGAAEQERELEPVWLLDDDGELFCRYRVRL